MMNCQPDQIRELSLSELIVAVRQETARSTTAQPSSGHYAHEMLRRAICDRDDAAWVAVIDQYQRLVLAWVRRHPMWSRSIDLTDDEWIYTVFGRFSVALKPERFESFNGLPALLHYLRACAHSVLIDARREQQRSSLVTSWPETDEPIGSEPEPDLAGEVLDRQASEQLWQLVMEAAKSESERVAAHLRFQAALAPREIQQRRPDLFPATAHVYRAIRNLLERLRHNPAIQRYYLELMVIAA